MSRTRFFGALLLALGVTAMPALATNGYFQLGYGTPYYRNAGYTIKKDWPRVTTEPPKEYTAYEERDPVGSYLREFDLPATWKGPRAKVPAMMVDRQHYGNLTTDGIDQILQRHREGQA